MWGSCSVGQRGGGGAGDERLSIPLFVTAHPPFSQLSRPFFFVRREVAPSDVSEFTLVGFVPEGTPCNAPIIENVGQWREQRWDGDFGTTPSDLYSMPGYPGKPTMTFLRDVSESAIGQCDVYGYFYCFFVFFCCCGLLLCWLFVVWQGCCACCGLCLSVDVRLGAKEGGG